MSVLVIGGSIATTATELADVVSAFYQAADAEKMQEKVSAALTALGSNEVVGFGLAGGGDGHTFITELLSSAAGGTGSLTAASIVRVRFYVAASEDALPAARAAAVAVLSAEAPPAQGNVLYLVDDQVAGAAKGTRFMGMLVCAWVTPAPG